MLENQKVIYLADRYYGSAEIISHLEGLRYSYVIRGKSNFYKKQVASMESDDEWIEVEIDKNGLKISIFSRSQGTEKRKSNP